MDELVDGIVRSGVLSTPRIIDAFRATDRADFVPDYRRVSAYDDQALPIGYEQTISQPSTVAFMLELLAAKEGQKILDIGTGSGWSTALLAHIVGPTGSVLGIERIPELVTFGSANLAKYDLPHAHIERAGLELGAPDRAPFDRILVSATSRELPRELISQLTEGGILIVPVAHAICRVVRVEHQPIIDRYEGFVFVPLIRGN